MSEKKHGNHHPLQVEIRRLEARVQELNDGPESAYEKALLRSYEQVLEGYRARLAALGTA